MATASEVVAAFVWIEYGDEGADDVVEAGYCALADTA
jgi:hypothetical protein